MHERTPSPTPLAWLMEGRRVNAEASLRTPESISQPYQEVDGDSSPRKRKDRETSTEPDINGKKPRTLNTPADVEGGHTSSASNSGMRLGSRFAANPSGGMVEGEGQNLDTAIDLTASGITSPKESLTSPTTPPEPPTATFPRRPQACQCSMCGDSESEVDEEFDNRVINPENSTTTFKDIHTSPDTVKCLRLLTIFLRDPAAFQFGVLSRHASSGVLLYGPPGTGKTMLARALAKEAGARMISITMADIQSELVGVAEKKIHRLFSYARRHHPCIIFIDEADSCFRSRSAEHAAHHQITFLNQFLTEMDGVDTHASAKPIVVAATNRPFDIDEGILRRLGRRIMVDIPDVRGREEILKLHLDGEKLHHDLDLAEIARHTQDFTGSDIRDLVYQAAIDALLEIHGDEGEQPHDEKFAETKSGANRVIGRKHFLSAKKSVSAAPKSDLVAKISEFHTKYGTVGGAKGNVKISKQGNGSR